MTFPVLLAMLGGKPGPKFPPPPPPTGIVKFGTSAGPNGGMMVTVQHVTGVTNNLPYLQTSVQVRANGIWATGSTSSAAMFRGPFSATPMDPDGGTNVECDSEPGYPAMKVGNTYTIYARLRYIYHDVLSPGSPVYDLLGPEIQRDLVFN